MVIRIGWTPGDDDNPAWIIKALHGGRSIEFADFGSGCRGLQKVFFVLNSDVFDLPSNDLDPTRFTFRPAPLDENLARVNGQKWIVKVYEHGMKEIQQCPITTDNWSGENLPSF